MMVDCCASGVHEDHDNEAPLHADAIDSGAVLIKAVLYEVASPGAIFETWMVKLFELEIPVGNPVAATTGSALTRDHELHELKYPSNPTMLARTHKNFFGVASWIKIRG